MNEDKNTKHPLDWNAKLVRFFYDNSRLVWMVIAIILIGGVFSLLSFKREGFPNITIKSVAVQTIYPGATANEVEEKVTKEIESSIKDAKGMKDFSSTSSNSFSQVIVNFDESVSVDQAIQDVQSKVSAIKGDLPSDVQNPKIATFSTSGPAFTFGVTEDGKSMSEIRASVSKLADEIQSISGVKKATFNDPDKEILVSVDETKLANLNISTDTLATILKGNNLNFPTGTIESNGKLRTTTVIGAYGNIDEIRNLILGVDPVTHTPVRLSDVAVITQGVAQSDSVERFGYYDGNKMVGVDGVYLNIEPTSDGDFIKVKKAIDDRIAELKDNGTIDKNLRVEALYDQAAQTKSQIAEITDATLGSKKNLFLLGGFQLLFIAMLLLVNWRAALVAAMSLPFAFGFTFISLKVFGVDLNTMVLFSLILVLGLVVDPAIVMVEAVQRYRDLNYKSRDAVIESGRRYGASLFMAVLTSLLVFVPFGVVSGYFGQIIKYIPLTVIPALVASYFVPVALLPYLTKTVIREKKGDQKKAVFGEDENLSKAARFVMGVNSWILESFWHRTIVVVISIVLIGLSVSLVVMGKIQIVQFAKPADTTIIEIQGVYPKGITFLERENMIKQVEQDMQADSGIESYFLAQENTGGVYIYGNLKDKSERGDASEKSGEIVKRLKDKVKQLKFDDIIVVELASGPPESSYQIQTQLASNDLSKLESAATETGKFLSGVDHVIKVNDGFSGQKDQEIMVNIDRAKTEGAGLSVFEVASQIKAYIDQTDAGKVTLGSDVLKVEIQNSQKISDQTAIGDLLISTRTGQKVKVSDIATITSGQGVGVIERYNGGRYVTIQARVDDTKHTAEVQKKLDDYLSDAKLKQFGIDGKLNKGDIGDITKSFTDLGIALVVAIMLTYVVLVLQFKSFSLPLIMLYAIPLSTIGVFPALWLTHSQFGFLELLGITILVGIVENVAIFLIDYANQLVKEQGMSPKEAIIRASGVRFRPILLTKLVALGGLLPLAIESDFWRGLSLVIIAGIGLSGFFSLVVIPILYVGIMNLRSKFYKKDIVV